MIRQMTKIDVTKPILALVRGATAWTLACGWIMACGQSGSELRIFGGQPVSGDDHAETVAIVSERPGEGRTLVCTGTLITYQHVVTAAHCLDGVRLHEASRGENSHREASRESLNHLKVVMGTTLDGRAWSIQNAHRHPEYKKGPRGNNDIAILQLENSAELVRPARLLHSFADLERSKSAEWRLVGFGTREDGSKGTKYFVDTIVRQLHAQEAVVGGDGRDACMGDSGGPAFVHSPVRSSIDSRVHPGAISGASSEPPLIGGVVSRGLGVGCGRGGFVTMISDHVCWIEALTNSNLTPWWSDSGCSWSEAIPSPGTFTDACLGASHPAHVAAARAVKKRLGADTCRAAEQALKTVQELDLSDAMLRNIDVLLAAIQQQSSVQRINLRGNELRHFGIAFNPLQSLEIDVGYNDLSEQTLENLQAQRNLRVLGMKLQRRNFQNTTFLQTCENDSAPDPVRHTIAALRYSLLGGTCAGTNILLVKRATLRLSGRQIVDLTPLSGLQVLEELDLSNNPNLIDLTPVRSMERLRKLNLRGSPAADVSVLAELISAGLQIERD